MDTEFSTNSHSICGYRPFPCLSLSHTQTLDHLQRPRESAKPKGQEKARNSRQPQASLRKSRLRRAPSTSTSWPRLKFKHPHMPRKPPATLPLQKPNPKGSKKFLAAPTGGPNLGFHRLAEPEGAAARGRGDREVSPQTTGTQPLLRAPLPSKSASRTVRAPSPLAPRPEAPTTYRTACTALG